MTDPPAGVGSLDQVALLEGVLTGAFFSPLHLTDLFGFFWGQEGLLGLEREEVFDLFVRGAIAAETIDPEGAEGRDPLAWLLGIEEPSAVGAHALASLRHDRPFLFHRLLYFLPAVREGRLDPDEFELVEDFLKQAMRDNLELRLAAETEIAGVRASGFIISGMEQDDPPPEVIQAAEHILATVDPAHGGTDVDLVLWMSRENGLGDLPSELAGPVMVEVWSRWVGAVVGSRPDLDLLRRLMPELDLTADQLAQYVPPEMAGHVIGAQCPYCGTRVALELGETVAARNECPHLVFVGTSDELHLMQALRRADLGSDFVELMTSYYHSPPDLDLFSQIANDLFEMLSQQGRVRTAPIECPTAGQGFYFLKAYFAEAGDPQATRH